MESGLRILYIEDSVMDQKIFARHLKNSELAAEVVCISTFEEAYKMLEEETFDLVFSDFHLPDKDAIQITHAILELDETIPIVVVTGQEDAMQAAEVIKAGASDYISKDRIGPVVLTKYINNILRIQREKKKARELEEELAELYSNTQAILENTEANIWSFNNSYNIIGFNQPTHKSFNEQFGIEIKTGDNILEILTDAFKENWEPMFQKALSGDRCQAVSGYETSTNSPIYLELACNPIIGTDGKITGVSCFAFNVTERIKNQEELQKSQTKYRDLVEYSMAMISTQSMSGVIENINEYGAKQLGYTIEEVEGRNLSELLSEKSRRKFTQYMITLRNTGTAREVLAVMDKQGFKKYFAFHNTVRQKPDETEEIISYAQDITERILAERQLETAKKLAEEASRVKTHFLANMSHEIRTPMNAILGFTDILMETELNDEQLESAQTIKEAGNNLLALINDILDFSKIESGKLNFEQVPFNINTVLESTMRLFENKVREKGLSLELKMDVDHPRIIGDPHRLKQIVTNLVNNAIKFTNNGGVTVQLRSFGIRNQHQTIQICVEDTGIGIPQTKLGLIFNSFTQASSDTTRMFGGSGLGLAIVKHLCELQNGHITVQSTEGEGSVFTATIPYAIDQQETPLQHHKVTEYSKYNLNGMKVLVCEDNPMNQSLIGRILKKWNTDFEIAANGAEGIQKFEAGAFDLILMDIQMPEMDGYEATRRIREKSDVPIIAMSAHAMKEKRQESLDMGMNEYITKPFNQETLYGVIQELIVGQSTTPSAAAAENEEDLYNLSQINELSQGNQAFVHEIIGLYLKLAPKEIKALRDAHNASDFEEQAKIIHKLKSSFSMLGMNRALQLAERLEEQLNKSHQPPEDQINTFIQHIEASVEALEQHPTSPASAG